LAASGKKVSQLTSLAETTAVFGSLGTFAVGTSAEFTNLIYKSIKVRFFKVFLVKIESEETYREKK
jgi:hypothetical protein